MGLPTFVAIISTKLGTRKTGKYGKRQKCRFLIVCKLPPLVGKKEVWRIEKLHHTGNGVEIIEAPSTDRKKEILWYGNASLWLT